ncbi:hypothetical protein MLD38_025081 [Melastoma candidum]|uniref:Uncharacterized protein n=1 Tax=Melastoma candidum TaxID=119954 RepID=A0ACB9NVV1_9MYRT|nr:hypothetical protein MLD38_025081 [Melastoma candidum]
MDAPPSSRLQGMLQAAVQSVKWTYSLFWQICPQQGILVWGDGYYNGPIKTRKTVQPMEVSTEEASLQRSQQLRELYESLSAGETNQPPRRPCAALSPEDLTETEWFYLMCVSFSFPPGVGLPGKALARRQHVWQTGANEADSKTFSRAILAKSAHIQTVVCIPLLDGVVEFGSMDKVPEDLSFINHVKTFFVDHHGPHPPKPALSEHSTSNPATSSEHPRFHSPSQPTVYVPQEPPADARNQAEDDEVDEDYDDDDDDDDDDEEDDSDSEAKTGRNNNNSSRPGSDLNPLGAGEATAAEPSEFEMSEDIRLGSPDDGSNNLDSDFPTLSTNHRTGRGAAVTGHQQRRGESYRAEPMRRWQGAVGQEQATRSGGLCSPPPSGHPPQLELSHEDAHYSQTVSTILQCQHGRWAEESSTSYAGYSSQSAFSRWSARADAVLSVPSEGNSQWLLKCILFSVPLLHSQCRDENRDSENGIPARFRKGTQADELSANHVMAERRRREKLNERFIILRSLVPFVTKMDKASILGDTIEYVKQLREKIQDLEARNRQIEAKSRSSPAPGGDLQRSTSMKELRTLAGASAGTDRGSVGQDKRKMRIVEVGAKPKAVEPHPPPPPPPQPTPTETSVQVSIIESDALLELQCPHREGLLLDVMQMLREHRVEVTAVQSSLTNGFFSAELRAKVKENTNGKKASIVEVKRAIQQIIPHTDS